MSDDELVLACMQEEQSTFETQVFELLFGADARPPETADERRACPPRVFSYEDAISELAKVSRSLELLFRIQEHYKCPDNEADDTQSAFEFRELLDNERKRLRVKEAVDRLRKDKSHGC